MERQIQQAIEMETIHRVISNNMVDAVWAVDVETLTFEYMSESVQKVSGYPAEEYIGKSVGKTMTPESFQSVFQVLKEEISIFEKSKKNVKTLELEMMHKTGRLYWVEIKAKLIESTGGRMKLVGATKDISHRKKMEREKDESIARLGKIILENERLLKENKILIGLLPICSGCKRIRDDNGKWWPMEAYVRKHTEADFTHTICSDCREIFYKI